MDSVPRTITAFMTAPLVVPVIMVLYFDAELSSQWLLISPIALMFSYLGTVVFGIPVYLLFRRHGWVSIWHILGMSIVGGWLLWAIFWLLFGLSFGYDAKSASALAGSTLSNIKPYFWPIGVAGAVYGLVFWLIARPDRARAQGFASLP